MPGSFKVDEDLPLEIVEVVGRYGHTADHVRDEGLGGSPDVVIWEAVNRESRILLTADKGFANPNRYLPGEHVGVVLLRARPECRANYVQLAEKVMSQVPTEQLLGAVVAVSFEAIRLHRPESSEGEGTATSSQPD